MFTSSMLSFDRSVVNFYTSFIWFPVRKFERISVGQASACLLAFAPD